MTDKQKAERGLALLIEARRLFREADNRQTVDRIRAAISSARGAVRIQDYRETRRLIDRREAGAVAFREGLPRTANPISERPEYTAGRAEWFAGYDGAAYTANGC